MVDYKNFNEKLFLQHKDEKVNAVAFPRLKKIYSYEWEKIVYDNERPYIWHDSFLSLEN